MHIPTTLCNLTKIILAMKRRAITLSYLCSLNEVDLLQTWEFPVAKFVIFKTQEFAAVIFLVLSVSEHVCYETKSINVYKCEFMRICVRDCMCECLKTRLLSKRHATSGPHPAPKASLIPMTQMFTLANTL